MSSISVYHPLATAALTAGVLGGCVTAKGPSYAETIAAAASTVGAVAGDAIAGAAESAGKTCGGPYRLTPPAPADALPQLDRLRASE